MLVDDKKRRNACVSKINNSSIDETQALRLYSKTNTNTHGWGGDNDSTWDYMSAVSQYSYLFSYYLIPETFKNTQPMQEFMEQTEWGRASTNTAR